MALGGNLGDGPAIFRSAVAELGKLLGAMRVAPLYASEPVSALAQPDYWNSVALGECSLSAPRLLAELQAIERRHGRRRPAGARAAAPRTLDLDLLFLGGLVRRRRAPLLPHPRMRERRFVLAPLADLAPDLRLPPDGRTVRELLASLPRRPWVRRAGGARPRSSPGAA